MMKLSVIATVLLLPFAGAATPAKEAGMIAGGIVEGFVGADNVKTCIKGMAIPIGDIEEAVKDFEKKKAKAVMQGLHELADALYALPDALATCNATDSDVKQIVHALAQFHKPKSFVFHLGKNLVVNRHEIYNEIFTSVSDYKAQKWSDFGVQIGLALHKFIVGADENTVVADGLATPAKDAGMIAGGIVEGFIGADNVKTCINGMAIPMGDFEEAVKDFEKKKARAVMNGLHELADALYALPDALATCNATDSDVKQIVHALAQFHKPKTFVFHLGKNLVVNRHEIYNEIFTSVSDYKAQKWSDFGVQIGLALHKFIVGAVENTMAIDATATPAKDAGMIAGGIVEGFIGADNIKTCINGMAIPMGDFEEAVKDFGKKKAKAVMQGLHELADALYALPDALATCNATDGDVKQIVHALAQFHKPKTFVFHLGKNLVVNRHEIYSEIFTSVSDYKAQKWSDFGVQIGLALHKLIVGADENTMVADGIATPAQDAAMIAGGIVEGFVGAENVKTCIKGMAIPMGDFEEAVKDFEKKKAKAVMQGLHELADALYALPDALATCNAADNDVKQIVHALTQFHKPKTFVFHLGKNLVVNRHEIYSEIFTSVSDYKTQKWSDFGVQIGLALHKLIVGADENTSVTDGSIVVV